VWLRKDGLIGSTQQRVPRRVYLTRVLEISSHTSVANVRHDLYQEFGRLTTYLIPDVRIKLCSVFSVRSQNNRCRHGDVFRSQMGKCQTQMIYGKKQWEKLRFS
jgi:hypothetical protein